MAKITEGELIALYMHRSDLETQAGRELTDEEWDRVGWTRTFDRCLAGQELREDAPSILDSILEEATSTSSSCLIPHPRPFPQ
jgi:hypothetical protein